MPREQIGCRYAHFKGGIYRVICEATQEADGVQVIVYESVGSGHAHIWTRPKTSWCEPVVWPDGVVRPRFVPLRGSGGGE